MASAVELLVTICDEQLAKSTTTLFVIDLIFSHQVATALASDSESLDPVCGEVGRNIGPRERRFAVRYVKNRPRCRWQFVYYRLQYHLAFMLRASLKTEAEMSSSVARRVGLRSSRYGTVL